MQRFISYLRVSTDRQGKSGLGLQAQKEAIRAHLGNTAPIASYVEVESGRRSDRVELRKALDHAKRSNAILVISRLDRLARNARFLLGLIDSGVEIRFCDLPEISGASGRFMLTALAATAEMESGLVSERTRAALAACKARGKVLGARPGASPLSPFLAKHGNAAGVEGARKAADRRAEPWRGVLQAMLDKGLSYGGIARELAAKGERTVRGGSWDAKAVSRMVARLDLSPATA